MNEILERYLRVPTHWRIAGAAIVYAIVVALYFFLLHQPALAKVGALQTQLEELDRKRQEKELYVANLAQYEARLAELQSNLQMARAMLPDDPAVPEFLAQLGSKARQAGLTIETFEPKEETPRDFFSEIAFRLRVRGSYHEIASFIDSIGKLDRIVNVSEISMTNPLLENKKMVVRSDFTVKTYRFLTEEQRKVAQAKAAAAATAKAPGGKK
jgi:type IV pilus assembly protein PilO